MRGWIKTLIAVVIFCLLTNAGQYFLWKSNIAGVEAQYQQEIAMMQETINNIGPLVDVYSVRTITSPGDVIKQEDLTIVQSPASMVSDAYVLDPSQVVGKYYKISINPGTPITQDLVMEKKVDNSLREVDIIADVWPVGLSAGDYVDFEITYPLGESYVVLSKARIAAINEGTIKLNLTGTERHLYGATLVDYFVQKNKGSMISLVKYPEPGIQESALVTYSVPDNILAVITADPNVVQKVDAALNAERRAMVEASLGAVSDEEAASIASGRSIIGSEVKSATNSYYQNLKEEAEQEAWEAFEKAEEQPLNIQEGVVE